MLALREQIDRLASGRSGAHRLPSVLLQGETGTGKGLVARLLHQCSRRAQGPFVDINCAAIPETLLEAELFGFERGAFTDARQAKAGLFQTAHGGTIFLDEIGLLPDSLQGKLLKVIEERSVRRLGGTRVEPIDVWVVAATSGITAAANLREDLYHRLAVVTLELPPLRERGDDILLLAEVFLAQACTDYGLAAKTLADDAREALRAHAWPGNVRELMNVMERVALLSDATRVTADQLHLPLPPTRHSSAPRPMVARALTAERLLDTLGQTGWNVLRTAAMLGTTRSTVRYRIRKFGLRPGAAPSPVPAAPAPPATTRLAWESRHVTLLRATIGAVHDPGNPVETVRILQELVAKVESFGGRIEDVDARGFVAAFGFAPAEDAPWRAAHAAMALRNVVERYATNGTAPPPVRIAVHGEDVRTVTLGETTAIDLDDKRRVWAMLDRLVLHSEPNAIRVSQALAPFLERRFRLVGAADVDARRTYHVAGHEPAGFTVGGRITRYVGRRQEREMLQARLAQARAGRGQVVAITGDAGIGKSRLLHEFRQQLPETVMCIEGRCLSYGSGTAYLPVLDLVRGVCRITEADGPGAIADKVRASAGTLGMPPSESVPFLLNALSLADTDDSIAGLPPETVKARTFDAIGDLLVRTAQTRPLVVVLEDLHWVDGVSDELIARLVEAVPASPILLLLTYRSSDRPRWITSSAVSLIALTPLSPDESVQVASLVLQGAPVPDALARLVVARADGNPFYIEELTRAVAAGTCDATSDAIPDTVQGILSSRIGRLGPTDRRVLQTAAVIGKDFPSALVATVVDLPAAEVRASLGRLQQAEFVYRTSVGAEPRYAFKHPLTHEVAYGGLALDDRRALHARIVDVLEVQHADRIEQHVEALARHAVGAEAWAIAARYLYRAGERAFQRSANHEAVAFLEQGIEACHRVGDGSAVVDCAIDTRFLLQLALFTLGEHARIRRPLLEAEALAETAGDHARQARAAGCLATHSYVIGEHAEGLRAARRGLTLAETLADPAAQIGPLLRLGFVHHARAEFAAAATALRRALDLLTRCASYENQTLSAIPSVHARTWLVWCLADVGDFDEARDCSRRGRETADERRHPYSQIMAAWGRGYCELAAGRVGEAIGAFEESLALCRASSNVHWFPRVAASVGYAWALRGRVDEGVSMLERGIAEAERIGLRACSPLLITWLGEAYDLGGRRADAAQAARRALDRARQQGERGHEANALRLLAELEQSEKDSREAMDRAGALGMRPLLGRCHHGRSVLLDRLGDHAGAEADARAAREIFAALGVEPFPA